MKLKCVKCGIVINKRKEVFDHNIKTLGISPEDYKAIYHCRACRPNFYFDWYTISKLDLSEQFLDTYKDKIDWYQYLSRHEITEIEKFVKRYKPEWKYVLRTQDLSEELVEKYVHEFDHDAWTSLWAYRPVTIQFIERHIDKVSWRIISECQNLPEEFIEKYADKVDWNAISKYRKLSPEFVIKHIDKINESIYKNDAYNNYPDTLKLLLQQKFGR
jgi:hypothetical protein